MVMDRRSFLVRAIAASLAAVARAASTQTAGQCLAQAARAQVGITTSYDPTWTKLSYPGGDVPRSIGVCAGVVNRAARDALSLDLQRLVHEDMVRDFAAYPARKAWGSRAPDANIDHRRILNLETYFTRSGARLWAASAPTAGDAFPHPLELGDTVTWLLDARLPHIGIVTSLGAAGPTRAAGPMIVHNIGRGAEESSLHEFFPHRAVAHYRWPAR